MKVRCVYTSYKDNQDLLKHYSSNLDATLDIVKNNIYTTYGMLFYDDNIEYLIQDVYYMPSYYSTMLFEIIDSQLPYEEWHWGKHSINKKSFYILGSKEMATSYDTYESVVLHNNEGLLHFEQWRNVIDQQYQ